MRAVFQTAFPYANDKMSLPVRDLDSALPFYTSVLGFSLVSRTEEPQNSAVLERDAVQIGLCENGGDSEQEGCFFGVDSVETACAELKANGWEAEKVDFRIDQYGDKSFKVFFVVAPDGLCYCLGEQV